MSINKLVCGLLLSGLLAGCEVPSELGVGQSGLAVGGATGKAKLMLSAQGQSAKLTFANVTSANVTIDQVEVRDIDGNKFTYSVNPFPINLMGLDSAFGMTLSRMKIPAGEYDQLRLHIAGDGEVNFQNGCRAPLTIPSGEESGLKVFLDRPIEIVDNAMVMVVMRVDVSNSFVFTGNGRACRGAHFKPVVTVAVSEPVILPSDPILPEPSSSATAPASDPDASLTPVSSSSPVPTADPAPVSSDPAVEVVPLPPDTSTSDPSTGTSTTIDPVVTPPDGNSSNFSGWLGV